MINFEINKSYTFWDRKEQKYISFSVVEIIDSMMYIILDPGDEEKQIFIDSFNDERYMLILKEHKLMVDVE